LEEGEDETKAHKYCSYKNMGGSEQRGAK